MVFFVCEGCNETLKKNQVDKHASHCRSCWAVTCVDCNVTFPEDTYRAHTSCVSEAQRYEGKLYKAPKQKVKRNPQEIWNEVVEAAAGDALSAPKSIQHIIGNMASYGNVPRNEKKFGNFVKNSLNVRSDVIVKEIWNFLCLKQAAATAEQEKEQAAASQASEKESSSSSSSSSSNKDDDKAASKKRSSSAAASEGKDERKGVKEDAFSSKRSKADDSEASKAFSWHKAISKALKAAPGKSVPLKALRKSAIALYSDYRGSTASTAGASDNSTTSKSDMKSAFKEALKTHPKATQEGKGDGTVVTYGSKNLT